LANLFLEHARDILGMGLDWQIASWKDLDWRKPNSDLTARLRVTGVCAPVLPDGRVAWEYQDKATRKSITFTRAEHATWVRAWEIKTGKCSNCAPDKPGQQWMGWHKDTGDYFLPCTRCHGTGQAPGFARGGLLEVAHG
jgi:hypothetical protein